MQPRVASHLLCGLIAWMTLAPVAFSGMPDRNPVLTPIEEELVAEINRVRMDPAGYAAILIEKRPFYRGRRIVAPPEGDQGHEVTEEITQEGLPALEEAVAVLRTTRRRGRLATLPEVMSRCSRSRCETRLSGNRGALRFRRAAA